MINALLTRKQRNPNKQTTKGHKETLEVLDLVCYLQGGDGGIVGVGSV